MFPSFISFTFLLVFYIVASARLMRKSYGMITLTGIFSIIITDAVNAQNKCPLTRNAKITTGFRLKLSSAMFFN
jgi:hypothetical protein